LISGELIRRCSNRTHTCLSYKCRHSNRTILSNVHVLEIRELSL